MILASIFRDAEDYVERWGQQVDDLAEHVDVRTIVAYGDCTDNTGELLEKRAVADDVVLRVDHGGPKIESVDHPRRWHQISIVCNAVMNAVHYRIGQEPLVYVESDLIWEPATILRLVEGLKDHDAVAPMSMRNGRFYDIWGYVKDGVPFREYDWKRISGYTPLDSAGSCIAMRPEVARVVTFGEWDCVRGLGFSISLNGYCLWLDPTVEVQHP